MSAHNDKIISSPDVDNFPAYVIGVIPYVHKRNPSVKTSIRAEKIRLQKASFPDNILTKYGNVFSSVNENYPMIDKNGKIPGWHYPHPAETNDKTWRPNHEVLDHVIQQLEQIPSALNELNQCLRAKKSLKTIGLNRQPMIVRNARKLLPSSTSLRTAATPLFSNGFCLVPHISKTSDWNDDKQIISTYYREVEDVCSKVIAGTQYVFANSFIRRESQPQEAEDQIRSLFQHSSTGRAPASASHNDFTTSYKEALIRSVETGVPHTQCFGFEEAIRSRFRNNVDEAVSMLRQSRIIIINTWRSTTPGQLERDPIALCDRRTISPSSVHVTTGTRREESGKAPYFGPPPSVPKLAPVPSYQSDCFRAGKRGGGVDSIPSGQRGGGLDAYFATYDPCHQWYFYPKVTPEELILWVGYDSDANITSDGSFSGLSSSLAGATLHTGFNPEGTNFNGAPRTSLDVRVLCILPKSKPTTGTAGSTAKKSPMYFHSNL
mmetsp:Transcript_13774/g.20999  ORF Transcript_13774/g.20999 Transcript_13774/m.20999 type:complete len:491 (-) Transcript_13774:29-1501(-)